MNPNPDDPENLPPRHRVSPILRFKILQLLKLHSFEDLRASVFITAREGRLTVTDLDILDEIRRQEDVPRPTSLSDAP